MCHTTWLSQHQVPAKPYFSYHIIKSSQLCLKEFTRHTLTPGLILSAHIQRFIALPETVQTAAIPLSPDMPHCAALLCSTTDNKYYTHAPVSKNYFPTPNLW